MLEQRDNLAGAVLCGGRSLRMGHNDKTRLTLGGRSLPAIAAARLGQVCGDVCVVARPKDRPEQLGLSDVNVSWLCDRVPDRGPVEGLCVALRHFQSTQAAAVAVTGCDYPLLDPALFVAMHDLLDEADGVVVEVDEQRHPLLAIYRPSVLTVAEAILAGKRRSLHAVTEAINCRVLDGRGSPTRSLTLDR